MGTNAVQGKLTALGVAKPKTPGMYGDGGGLWLQVTGKGGKSWVFRYTLRGKSREMGLGPVNTFSLAEARVWMRDLLGARDYLEGFRERIRVRRFGGGLGEGWRASASPPAGATTTAAVKAPGMLLDCPTHPIPTTSRYQTKGMFVVVTGTD